MILHLLLLQNKVGHNKTILNRNEDYQQHSTQQPLPKFANQPPKKTPQRMTIGNAIDYATYKKNQSTQISAPPPTVNQSTQVSTPPLPVVKAPTWVSGKGDDLPSHV